MKVENDQEWSITLDIDQGQRIPKNEVRFDYFIASYDDPTLNAYPL